MAIDYKPDQNKYKNMTPFKTWLIYQINTWGVNNFPFLENDFDQLTNYGMLMKLMKAINDNITNQNLVEEDMTKLYEAFTELQKYINDTFDELNLQEEVNNKLDQMVLDGTFERLLSVFIKSTIECYFPQTDTYGDMSILECKSDGINKNIIIDFADDGGLTTYLNIKNKLINKGLTKFDYAIVSHYHIDHVGNLLYMLNDNDFDFSECTFYLPPTPDYTRFIGSTSYIPEKEQEIINALNTRNIPYIQCTNETTVNVFDDISINFLNADVNDFDSYYNEIAYNETIQADMTIYNNFSMVTQVNHKNLRLLFTGDIQKAAETVIIDQGLQIPDLLKIEHHGINARDQYDFEYENNFWNPKIAVGMSNVTTQYAYIRRKAKDIETYFTFYNGDIEITSSGYNLISNTENGRYNPEITLERYNIMKGITGYLNLAETNVPHLISANEDLDDYVAPGTYCCPTQAIANTLSNKPPINVGFKLITMITTIPEHVYQIAIQNFNSKVWTRHGNKEENNDYYTFSNWATFSMLGDNLILGSGTDLNDLVVGNYSSYSGEITNSLLNKPDAMPSVAFSMEVKYLTDRTDRILQTIYCNSKDNIIFVRALTADGWSNWSAYDTMMNRLIPNNTSLNNVGVGNWCSNAAAQTSTLTNVPTGVTGGFKLECRYLTWNNTIRLYQKLIPNIATPEIYYRTLSGNSWGNWYKFTGTQV